MDSRSSSILRRDLFAFMPKSAALDPYLTNVWKSPGSQHKEFSFGRGCACTASDMPQFQFTFLLISYFRIAIWMHYRWLGSMIMSHLTCSKPGDALVAVSGPKPPKVVNRLRLSGPEQFQSGFVVHSNFNYASYRVAIAAVCKLPSFSTSMPSCLSR